MKKTIQVGAILAGFLAAEVGAGEKVTQMTIYIGPHSQDGFVDADKGVMDSIKDIKGHFDGKKEFRLVTTPAQATLILEVLGRRSGEGGGSVMVPVGPSMIAIPINRRAIDVVLKVGTYERPFTSESADSDGTWGSAAKRVSKDVIAWVTANRARLEQ